MISDNRHLFDQLYKDVDGFGISYQARGAMDAWYVGHTYGEITYEGFTKMLAMLNPKKDEVFYDFGSGTGKAVYLAAMMSDIRKSVGVEIIKELSDAANGLLPKYRQLTGTTLPEISFITDDFTEIDFSDADLIFINATCMSFEFDIPFLRKLERLKKGTRIMTSTIYFESDFYTVHPVGRATFTWGDEDIFIHLKK